MLRSALGTVRPNETADGQAWLGSFHRADVATATLPIDSLRAKMRRRERQPKLTRANKTNKNYRHAGYALAVTSRSPFTPTFGASPPILAGRGELIEEFAEALEDGPGASGRATIYSGARGTGKTVLLNAIEGEARARGWLVISETATPGFIARLSDDHLPRLLADRDPKSVRHHLTSFGLPANLGRLEWERVERHARTLSFRSKVELLTNLLKETERGLLITLDELHHQPVAELREFGTVAQHAIREERGFAFAAAALPAAIDEVLADELITFLRRADRHHLDSVDPAAVRRALQQPIVDAARTITDDALDAMVAATGGYPFMIQLVGDRVWRSAGDTQPITLEHADAGIDAARRRLGQLVHAPALADASDVAKSFLLAMAEDDGPSTLANIGQRLGANSNYTSQYRLRLLALELIKPAGHGRVDFALPYLRDYLREHAATLVFPSSL